MCEIEIPIKVAEQHHSYFNFKRIIFATRLDLRIFDTWTFN